MTSSITSGSTTGTSVPTSATCASSSAITGGASIGSAFGSSATAGCARCIHKVPVTTPTRTNASRPSDAHSHLWLLCFGPDAATWLCDVVPKGLGADESNASSSGLRSTAMGCVSARGDGELGGPLEPRISAKYEPGAAKSSPHIVPKRSARASLSSPALPAASASESKNSASVCWRASGSLLSERITTRATSSGTSAPRPVA